jgi:hypothetical protein
MTINEMHIAFSMAVDGVESLNYIDFTPEEKDFWLNKAILYFVNERFTGLKGDSFEENQKRIEDLRILIVNANLTSSGVGSKPNSQYFTLPVNYWIADEEEVLLSNGYRGGITECAGDQYRSLIDNPFSGHRLKWGKAKPLRTFIGTEVELISDGNYTITTYYLRYLRKPTPVSSVAPVSNCDLNEYNHNEIVDMAVRMCIASIGDQQKYQIKLNEEQKNIN